MSGADQHKHDEWPNLEADPNAEGKTEGTKDTGTGTNREDLTKQFQELGQRLVATTRAAWQSEQRQELQREITDGLRTVREQLGDAIGSVRSSSRVQVATD